MLLDPYSRFMVKYDFTLRSVHGWGAPLALVNSGRELDVLTVLSGLKRKKELFLKIKDGDVVSLSALSHREADGIIVMLFRRRDANASTQIFEHEKTGRVRAAARDSEEHPAVSAHLVVSTRPHKAGALKYRAVLEEVPGLGRTYVRKILANAIKSQTYDALNSRKEKVRAHTLLSLDGLPSQTLGAAVSGGGIDYVELIRPPAVGGLDTQGLLPSPEKLKLAVRKVDGIAPLIQLLKVQLWARNNGWKDLRVQVRTKDNRHKVVNVDRDADAAQVLFVEADQVTFVEPLPACVDAINETVVSAAKNLLVKK